MVSRNSRRIACSSNTNRSGSAAELGVGFSEDTRSLLLPQERLVFSSSFTHAELSESCWSSSGEAKSGFPDNFFSSPEPRVSLPRSSQRRGRSVLLPTTSLYWFHSSTSGYLVVVLGFVGSFGGKFATENLSWLRVSFHENRLSSSFSSLFKTSTIDFGITLGNPSIINIQKSQWREIYVHSIRHLFPTLYTGIFCKRC